MDILRQQLLRCWAQYWLHHTIQKTVEAGLCLIFAGGTVTTVVVATPLGHKFIAAKPTPVAVTSPAPASHPTSHPHVSSPPSVVPPPVSVPAATPAAPAVSKPAVVAPAPTPIPSTQPSPGTGVKQLTPVVAPVQPSTSPPLTSSGTGTPTSSSSTDPSSSTSSSTASSPPASSTSPAPAAASGGYVSTNWSGYAALSGQFTSVSGSWVVPSLTGDGTETTGDAAWVGIGGVSSQDLIQAGTEDSVAADGTVSVFAFYELLPSSSLEIRSLPVSVGDKITVNINEIASGQWTISVTDVTNGTNYTTTVSYSSTHSSADWIEEDPSYLNGTLVPFDKFDHVVFTNGSTTQNGAPANITTSNAAPITLVDGSNKPIVTPSVIINSGTGFWATHD